MRDVWRRRQRFAGAQHESNRLEPIDNVCETRPFLFGLGPRRTHEVFEVGRRVDRHSGPSALRADRKDHLKRRHGAVGIGACDTLPHNDAKAVDVGLFAVAHVAQHFRRRPARRAARCHGARVARQPGQAEIANFRSPKQRRKRKKMVSRRRVQTPQQRATHQCSLTNTL